MPVRRAARRTDGRPEVSATSRASSASAWNRAVPRSARWRRDSHGTKPAPGRGTGRAGLQVNRLDAVVVAVVAVVDVVGWGAMTARPAGGRRRREL